ncbi:MAG: 1-acyl-sn-glycerol-3-phosphate acyltransferase [Leptospiraceae bacterium]|nr:1-acyl-sn-glycerol-3-phosphate acyltransferase [Leptospiraceae bacterium]MDW7976596.1 1-acyl-sn-glycerol-3-phosphate acyltransferase [Leptospiraceae bacterium]
MNDLILSKNKVMIAFSEVWEKLLYHYIPREILNFLYKYTQPEIRGLENIPKKEPTIIVPNHSGVLAIDALVLHYVIKNFVHRFPYIMSHNFWHSNEFLRYSSEKLGFIPQDFKVALKYLKENKLIILFPEAEEGNFKPSIYMYKLRKFNPGFVSLSILSNAFVVPTCIIGAEESNINLGVIELRDKNLKIPIPLNLFPFPVKWKIVFLKPIHFQKYSRSEAKNISFLQEAAQIVRMKIQHHIYRELQNRGLLKYLIDG